MKRALTEQKVLKKLGIPDFRHLTKDKVLVMASMLDKMDPEVAKKALEQFPDFASTAKDVLANVKETLDKSLEENGASVHSYYDTCNSVIQSLQKQLENKNLSFEDKKYIIEQMVYITNQMGSKDSENKKFLATIALMALGAAGAIVFTLGSVLGSNTAIESSDLDNLANTKLDDPNDLK